MWEFRVDIWRYAIPLTVKIFVSYLLLKDKILTREVMIRGNFNCPDNACSLCETGNLESALHLFFQCPYSLDIWNRVNNSMGCDILVQGNSVQEIWRRVTGSSTILSCEADGKDSFRLLAGSFGDSATTGSLKTEL
ncbi:zinc-binding in reverse transcriptase [Carex littledalei]|uniref:Zinc-binding in reverse transcriptase n=1 Tax=Carex littledalei TaxID=544730 RepID=A0A833QYY4_9POAL|nr:zinc-binding in reverse transcriptase [Carex littledalei]